VRPAGIAVTSGKTTMNNLIPASGIPVSGHPRGLATLFLTEMWERFSYYGMRALLVLFMVDATHGGMAMSDQMATSVYGIYTACVYLMALPGGWLADRVLGAQRAVWYGGTIIALGHFTLALPFHESFYFGLLLVVVGSGILKPNMSTLVADLYPEGGARRDAGFTIFYMGVNLGATIGPLTCSYLGEHYNWHYGFGAAGIGMVLGLIQFRATRHWLGTSGLQRGHDRPLNPLERWGMIAVVAAVVMMLGLCLSGLVPVNPLGLAHKLAGVIVALAVLYFLSVFAFCGLNPVEKKRVGVIMILFLASALFFAGFEQAGSSFNLFAERFTDRQMGWGRGEIPAGWFQTLDPVFIILFAPVFAWLWVLLARRNLDPSIPVKFAFGLLLLAAGFLVMAGAARVVASGHKALPVWLAATYLIHTFAELCLSPVGLSSVSKLAPRKLAGQMMGVWFLAASLGSVLAGLLAGQFNTDDLPAWPNLYLKITILPTAAGILLILLSRPLKRWMAGVQ
jgi:POT family proton-dependent oligopeptide transporter